MSHNTLIFSTITSTRVMFQDTASGTVTNPDNRITVICDAAPNLRNNGRHDRTRYTLTIQRAATANFSQMVTYSLLTLGLQGIKHRVKIISTNSSNNDAQILNEAEVPQGAAGKIPKTGTFTTSANLENPIETSIWFLRFSGQSCTIVAEAFDRTEVGEVGWTSGHFGGGHDNTPPGGGPD